MKLKKVLYECTLNVQVVKEKLLWTSVGKTSNKQFDFAHLCSLLWAADGTPDTDSLCCACSTATFSCGLLRLFPSARVGGNTCRFGKFVVIDLHHLHDLFKFRQ